MYLLESDVLSELRPGKAHPSEAVRRWAGSLDQHLFYLSAITILEQEESIRWLGRQMPAAAQALRRWASAVHEAFAGRILAFGEREAMLCAPLQAHDRQGRRDSMIAATALSRGLVLVTRNKAAFEGVEGVRLLDPWEFSPRENEMSKVVGC